MWIYFPSTAYLIDLDIYTCCGKLNGTGMILRPIERRAIYEWVAEYCTLILNNGRPSCSVKYVIVVSTTVSNDT